MPLLNDILKEFDEKFGDDRIVQAYRDTLQGFILSPLSRLAEGACGAMYNGFKTPEQIAARQVVYQNLLKYFCDQGIEVK